MLRSLGQNFLANTSILQRIAAASKLAPGDVVLEVGPGAGNLTRCLLAQGASISAVEKDRRLITSLTQEFPQVPAYLPLKLCSVLCQFVDILYHICKFLQVNIIQADILTCDLEALLKQLTETAG